MHDLLRAYARALTDVNDEQGLAQARLVNHFVHTARNVMTPYGRPHPRPPEPLLPGVSPEAFADAVATMGWYHEELDTIAAVLELCLEQGRLKDAANILMDLRPAQQVRGPEPRGRGDEPGGPASRAPTPSSAPSSDPR